MLTIHAKLVEAMIAKAEEAHPIEACGVIAGPAGSSQPLRLIPMHNAAQSKDFFEFDSKQQLQVWKEMDMRDEVPTVIYHSHTSSQAYPSRTDVQCAAEPHAHYVIISTGQTNGDKVRSYRIIDGIVIEERIKIVSAYQPNQEMLMVA